MTGVNRRLRVLVLLVVIPARFPHESHLARLALECFPGTFQQVVQYKLLVSVNASRKGSKAEPKAAVLVSYICP